MGLRAVFVTFLGLFAFSALADSPGQDKHFLLLQALNNPVKEEFGKFKVTLPAGVIVGSASYWILPATDKRNGESDDHVSETMKRSIVLQSEAGSLIAKVKMSEFPPGNFVFHLQIKPQKTGPDRTKESSENKSDDGVTNGERSFTVAQSLEVADPGVKGLIGVRGIDSDGDGVRDDIQRWINETFSSSEKAKAAAKQLAQDAQLMLLTAGDRPTSIASARKYFLSMDCLSYVLGGRPAQTKFRKQLEAKMENTRERILASIQSDADFKGQSSTPEEKDPNDKAKCRFDVEALRN